MRTVSNVQCFYSFRVPVSRPAQVRRLDVFAAAAGKRARSIVLVELEHVRKV